MDIFDVSDPANPARVGGSRVGPSGTSGNAGGFYVSGNYAYVAAQESGWQVIDVRKPANPTRVSGAEISGAASDVQVVGHYAYVADSSAGLQVIDVSDSRNPTRVGGYLALGFARRVHVAGNYAYVGGWRPTASNDISALYIIDVSAPTNPTPVSVFDTGFQQRGSLEDVDVVGHYAYLAGLIWSGSNFVHLAVLNVSDPAAPVLLGVAAREIVAATAVQVVGNYAYLLGFRDDPSDDYLGVLHVFDVSNPTRPLPVAGIDLGGEEAKALQMVGNYAYVAGDPGLTIVNVSDPTNPLLIGRYETDSSALDVELLGGYAYLLTRDLKAIDVSNPIKPMLADQYRLTEDQDDDVGLDVAGNHACVADGNSGLIILEIAQLPHLRSVSRLGQTINLSWDGATGLRLQRTSSLAHPVWTDIPDSDGRSNATLRIGDGSEFFRLMKP